MTGLVYHAGALGDFVAALPAIAAWRRSRAPHGTVALLGRPEHAALATGLVDEAWDAGAARFASLFAGSPSSELRAQLAGVASALVFAPHDAGVVRGLRSAGVSDVLRGDPFPRGGMHIVDHHLSLFPELAPTLGQRTPRIAVPAAAASASRPSARPIVLHPGSGSPKKNWPIDRFLAVAAALSEHGPIRWVLGPVEEESGVATTLARAFADAQLWRSLPLPELACRLAGSRLFVGNDSGVAHLAAAVGCPVVVLFGASDPAVWAPRGARVTVAGDGSCGMAAIPAESVLRAALAALDANAAFRAEPAPTVMPRQPPRGAP